MPTTLTDATLIDATTTTPTTTTSSTTPGPRRPPSTEHHVPDDPWLTATVRPAGSFGRADVGRVRAMLDALTACASIVVLDLQVARLRSPRIAAVIDEAARRLEAHGGCLLCVNADAEARTCLSAAGEHAVVLHAAGQP